MKNYCLLLVYLLIVSTGIYAQPLLDRILYGAAYYYEYTPYERLDKDVQMMKDCGINVVRIAESTWGVWEPEDGVFDFSKLDRVLDAMQKAGINVIIGTPTYAIPTWLAKEHPEVLAITAYGRNKYGARQNMDITNKTFRFYSERIIRTLLNHVKDHPAVIGYQADNETKHYNTAGDSVNALFEDYLKLSFPTTDSLNKAFGLNYWSNTINNWKDFPSMAGNVNASLGCAFSRFQRKLVTDYLGWQVSIINEYKKPGQFVTHNFDMEWRGLSFGIQPDVDHFAAAKPFDIAGVDIYHATAERLTGKEISFCGDLARSLKQNNYLVLETQAQSIAGLQELPYAGQLRLQAYSHLASGANMVEYWPWHSIHNAVETYWKGILSHDMETNPTYEEVKKTAHEFMRIGKHLVNLKKKNKVAILVDNGSLTALNWFPISDKLNYNDVVRQLYDALYEMNVSCDFVNTSSKNINDYSLVIVPPLYSVSDSLLNSLDSSVKNGMHIVFAFKSGFSNENVQVRTLRMPGQLRAACGFYYQQFININKLPLRGNPFKVGNADNYVQQWAELLIPEKARVLAWYDHPYWGKYAAITQNHFGKGLVTYFGSLPSKIILQRLLTNALKNAGAWTVDQQLSFPVVVKSGINQFGKPIHYYFNYSSKSSGFRYPYKLSIDLLTNTKTESGKYINLAPWELIVLQERD